ncbi:MAG: RraA family protein [Wenzhouxiangellaceae bacterium]
MFELSQLLAFDTPTICNALELIDRNRRNYGYTIKSFHVINTSNSPVVGFAKTATMRSFMPSQYSTEELKNERVKYYRYINEGNYQKICVMQDIDGEDSGRGPFWGEFNTRIHESLGVLGVITNGTVRDVTNLPTSILMLSSGLRPSHANVHIVDYCNQVNVNGMVVSDGDVIHADSHGAVCFPSSIAQEVSTCAKTFIESERPIIEGCKKKTLSIDEIIKLYMSR